MLNHVMIGSNDIEASKTFYDQVLGVVGCGEPMRNEASTGHVRYFYNHGGDTFCLTQPINDEPATPSNGFTLGIKCESSEQLAQLHETAIKAGGNAIEDGPGPRATTMGEIHLCYFTDPDGHKICGLYRPTA